MKFKLLIVIKIYRGRGYSNSIFYTYENAINKNKNMQLILTKFSEKIKFHTANIIIFILHQ